MYLSFFLGAQGAYPPPSGFQQYPPPYPGSATKSDDYNRQSAFNPNVWKNKPESLISLFEMMTDGKLYSAQSTTLVIFFVKVLFWRKRVIHIWPALDYIAMYHCARYYMYNSLFLGCTVVRFASFLSGGFITAIVVNRPERKLAKRTSVHCHK